MIFIDIIESALCKMNLVEDEYHFILVCPFLQHSKRVDTLNLIITTNHQHVN